MKIDSLLFGELEIDRDKIVTFERGIPGFPESKEYVFLELPDTPFFIMQSVSNELFFYVVNPYDFYQDYDVQLSDSVIETLRIEKPQDVLIYNIVTIPEDFQKATVNLKAPLVVNVTTRQGKQYILNEKHFGIRQPLFEKVTSSDVQEIGG
ncbi:flagellar assembly protein FliW [Ammoniphilus sp. 3BR4]|uniref:flagellar assembly protein FliW n=1 Tax=Ammoniphilus sp. 3BR4 TaxID=3158265 RepID=UPI0034677E65